MHICTYAHMRTTRVQQMFEWMRDSFGRHWFIVLYLVLLRECVPVWVCLPYVVYKCVNYAGGQSYTKKEVMCYLMIHGPLSYECLLNNLLISVYIVTVFHDMLYRILSEYTEWAGLLAHLIYTLTRINGVNAGELVVGAVLNIPIGFCVLQVYNAYGIWASIALSFVCTVVLCICYERGIAFLARSLCVCSTLYFSEPQVTLLDYVRVISDQTGAILEWEQVTPTFGRWVMTPSDEDKKAMGHVCYYLSWRQLCLHTDRFQPDEETIHMQICPIACTECPAYPSRLESVLIPEYLLDLCVLKRKSMPKANASSEANGSRTYAGGVFARTLISGEYSPLVLITRALYVLLNELSLLHLMSTLGFTESLFLPRTRSQLFSKLFSIFYTKRGVVEETASEQRQ